ncbi:MAG: hypothetical protein D6743_08970 [Calditrichaeota bacterium]|nr:MAG: hypothetical protein D6743_08970 [Calditrichota bacterium]
MFLEQQQKCKFGATSRARERYTRGEHGSAKPAAAISGKESPADPFLRPIKQKERPYDTRQRCFALS